jgi:flagellin
MAAVLGTNVASLWAAKNLQSAQSKMADSVERLSSGLRINRAQDDAAGLSIANSLTQQINGSNQGIRNLNDGISIVQTAEGAIAQASEMAQRMLTLSIQGSNGAMSTDGRTAIQNELKTLVTSISSIATRTKFGSTVLLDQSQSSTGTKMSIYAGADSTDVIALDKTAFYNVGATFASAGATLLSAGTTLTLSSVQSAFTTGSVLYKLSAGAISLLGTVTSGDGTTSLTIGTVGTATLSVGDVIIKDSSDRGLLTKNSTSSKSVVEAIYNTNIVNSTVTTAQTAFDALTTAVSEYITLLSTQRGKLGALQNQMEYSTANITELSSNLSSAKSRVIDTDYASETAALTKGQILQQAATAMLAQANQMPNVILSLLK